MALSAMSPCKDLPGVNEMAGLRAFLRSRCGSLKAAFAELDSHDIGQLTSDDFVKGLHRLGYTEDAGNLFRSIDGNKTGILTLKSFMNCFGDRVFDSEKERQSPSMSRSPSEDVWKSARIPKSPNSTPNLLTSAPVGSALKSGSALRSSTPEASGLASPHLPVAGADLLYARMSRVEEQVAAEQRLRCETEQRLTQHLNSLVGVSISEQLDVLREQLVEERMQRQVDITTLRATIETVRSMALRSVQENLEECVKSEVDKSIGEVRVSLEQTHQMKKPPQEFEQKLDELSKSMEGRLSELEKSHRSCVGDKPEVTSTIDADVLQLQKSANSFEERLDLLSSNIDLLTSNVELQAKQSLQLKEDVAALHCSDVKVHEGGEATSFEKVQDYVREKMDRLRVEWSGTLEEERARTVERSTTLTKALTQEFERSIVAQAVAEARTEARAAVSELETKNPSALQQAVLQLGQDIEALWQKLQSKAQGGVQEATRAAEKLCQEKMAATDAALKTQAEALEHMGQKLNVVEESMRNKLQALINKLDSKCIEGLVPVLQDLGTVIKDGRPKMLSVDKSLETSGWCSNSNSSGESNRLRNQRGAQCPHPSPAGSGSAVLPIGSPPAPPPQTQVLRQSSVRSLEESQQIDALFQENLRLREGELRLREQNLEIRERAMRLQEEAAAVPAVIRGNTGSARSTSPPAGKAPPCSAAGSPPHPLRQSRNSLPSGRHGPPQGPCQLAAGVPRVMASPPVMTRGVDCRSPPHRVERRMTPQPQAPQASQTPQAPLNRMRTPSPAVMTQLPGEQTASYVPPGQPLPRRV